MRILGRRSGHQASHVRLRHAVLTLIRLGISSGLEELTEGVLLTLHLAAESAPTNRLPRLRDIEVSLWPPDESGTQILAFKLLNSNQQDIFQNLCRDIVSVAARADYEAEAVSVALLRTWRWHHLLRSGRGTLLSQEEQKGLLGELFVLERLLLPNIDAYSAVRAWRGPLGSPKDFEGRASGD